MIDTSRARASSNGYMHVNRTSGLESNVGQKVKTLVTLYVPSKARRLLGQRWEAALRVDAFFLQTLGTALRVTAA